MDELVCMSCPLKDGLRVEPEGSVDAEVVIVGEAPGAEEEKQGRPFVGYSGRVLRAVLDVIGLSDSSKVYITNVVKCHPPRNQLSKEVVKLCKVFLERELLNLKNKKLIIALGATAKEFFNIPGSMTSARGKIFDTKYGKVLVTWHPAYRSLMHQDVVTGMSPYIQFVKDLARGSIYVEQGRMYKSVNYDVLEGGRLEEVLSEISGKVVAVDFETFGINIWDSNFRAVTVALACGGKSYVVDLGKIERSDEFLKEVFQRAGKLVFYNAGFDVSVAMRYGLDFYSKCGNIEDVQLMYYLLSGKSTPDVSLKDLVLDYLDVGQYWIDWKKTKIEDVPRERLYEYNAIDAWVTLRLYEIFEGKLRSNQLEWEEFFGCREMLLFEAYENVLKKILCLCIELNMNGMYVDVEYLMKLRDELKSKESGFLLWDEVQGVNLNSPKQVLGWLKEVGIDVGSTGKDALEGFLKESGDKISQAARERIEKLLEYRVIEKMLGTYIEPFLSKWICGDGCIHSKFSAVATDTGRLASSEPNLMNIPTRLGPVVEKAFISRFDGGKIIKADFSQHELRVACQYSKDRKMKEFFESGVDIHTKVAMDLYGMSADAPEKERKELRRRAKSFNFGVIYGRGWRSIALELGISEKEAKETVDRYFNMFSQLKRWLDGVKEFAKERGYVRSMFGRFRWISLDDDAEGWAQKAVNTPVQSAASDIASLTAWRIAERLYREGFKSKLVNFVHDSVIIDCPGNEVDEVCSIIKDEVRRIELPEEKFLDFEMDIEVGRSWGETKEEE
jgi:DNA polymerase-1